MEADVVEAEPAYTQLDTLSQPRHGLTHAVLQVRSCTLDTWLPEQVDFMARTGNQVANAYREARMSPTDRPTSLGPLELEQFIRRKARPSMPDPSRIERPDAVQPAASGSSVGLAEPQVTSSTADVQVLSWLMCKQATVSTNLEAA